MTKLGELRFVSPLRGGLATLAFFFVLPGARRAARPRAPQAGDSGGDAMTEGWTFWFDNHYRILLNKNLMFGDFDFLMFGHKYIDILLIWFNSIQHFILHFK